MSGPIPPYNNPAIEAQYYQPSRFVITGVTLGATTTITTSAIHNYVLGQQVRLNIPPQFGCQGISERSSFVVAIPAANQVTLDLTSFKVNPFVSATNTKQLPQILAIGDCNSGVINASGLNMSGTFIPGSFINISPV